MSNNDDIIDLEIGLNKELQVVLADVKPRKLIPMNIPTTRAETDPYVEELWLQDWLFVYAKPGIPAMRFDDEIISTEPYPDIELLWEGPLIEYIDHLIESGMLLSAVVDKLLDFDFCVLNAIRKYKKILKQRKRTAAE